MGKYPADFKADLRHPVSYTLLKTNFHEQFFSWVPYLFVYIGNGIRQAAPKTEQELLTFIKAVEKEQIEQGTIQAVGYRYVGIR